MHNLLVLGMLLWVVLVAVAEVPRRIPLEEIFANPTLSAPALSDDGKMFVFIQSQGDLNVVISRADAGSNLTPLAKLDDPEVRLAWAEWANSERILASSQGRNLAPVGGIRPRMTRLFGVNRDGSNFEWLGKRWDRYGQQQL